jgi:glycosyltransferase involved in cell wall biosynthesis
VRDLGFLVPGSIDQLTGGYLFARHLVDGMRALGRVVTVHELAGRFPDVDVTARAACAAALAAMPDGAAAVIDGLALPGFVECLSHATTRLDLIALVHHPLAEETGLDAATAARFAALEARLLPLLKGVLCPSARTAAAVAAAGLAPARIAVAPPGTMKPHRSPRAAVAGGPCRLLSVASVTPRKGHRVLIAALGRLGARDWRLDLIGSLTRDPAEAEAVRAAIATQGLAARVTLAGEWPQDRLRDAYAAADVFVLASYHEGYGMAFAEALAHGLPIVATTGGAVPETVPASAGLLVPPGDDGALAAALARVIDDRAVWARLAQGAAAAGAALPDWDQAVARWSAAAERLLQ